MGRDRSGIDEAKRRLPLPDLLRALGFNPPTSGEGNVASPFAKGRQQKTPSFSLFRHGDAWGWCDRTGGGEEKGDEITLLEKLEGRTPGEAIARYLALAGVESGTPAVAGREGEATEREPSPKHDTVPPDWAAAVAKFTPDHAARLAEWRGLSAQFVEWLHRRGLVGFCMDGIAFPVNRDDGSLVAAHIRSKQGRWFYTPKGAGCYPLTIDNPATAAKTLVFESQWDALAILDAMGWHRGAPDGVAVLITRGASNGRFAARAGGVVIAFPQNDPEKNGKRAGEEWLRDVAASARGEVFAVRVPEQFKDANDWTRAESVDVATAIASASPVAKPEVSAPTPTARNEARQDGGNGTQPLAILDPAAVLAQLGLYWLNASSSYFMQREEGGRVRFLEMGAAEIRRKLRVRGYRSRPDPESGEQIAPLDRILDAATETHAVDFAVNIGGTRAGVYDLSGGRILVRESPRLIGPKTGDFSTIEAFLAALLGGDGAILFCGWLKIAFEALRAGEQRPGQALIIIGPPDCGKSRIQHQIITPILGGRSADPKSYFFGRTDFNAELVGAEHLLIEEIPSSSRHEERQFFGERIKEIVANDTARLHKKNRDACTVSPFWRLSISLNDQPEKLRCLPPLTDDLVEKIIMLEAKSAPDFWQRFTSAADPRKAFREAIERELPAFAHLLLAMPIPEQFKGRRYGVTSYIPEEIAQTLFEGEPEHHLLLLLDKAEIFEDGKAWEGDAEDLKQHLSRDTSPVRASAIRLLGAYPTACGQYLARLAAKFPGRVKKHRKANWRGWIIHPPA